MKTSPTPSSPSTSLDITQEKRDLKKEIAMKEKHYNQICKKAEQIKEKVASFQTVYESKVGRLYARLEELENKLFKYQNICGYVDDKFTFSEAQKVFDDTMDERFKRMEEEFRRRNKVKSYEEEHDRLSKKAKEELKRLYRQLAREFHPDRTGGNDTIMKRINKAYKEGDIQALRSLHVEHKQMSEDETIIGLKHRLQTLTLLIQKMNTEIHNLQKSQLYTLIENTRETENDAQPTRLDILASELTEQILRKEKEVAWFVTKYGIEEDEGMK